MLKCSNFTLKKDLEKFINNSINKWANLPINVLLIEDGFRCKLERFISAPTASIVCLVPILMFWFQREKEKSTGRKKGLTP